MFRARIGIFFLSFLGILYLLLGAKPWSQEIQEALQKGSWEDTLRLRHFIAIGTWGATLFNTCVLLLLGFFYSKWSGQVPVLKKRKKDLKEEGEYQSLVLEGQNAEAFKAEEESKTSFSKKTGLICALCAILAIFLAGILAYPRLEQSLWGDEQISTAEHIHGYYKRNLKYSPDGAPYFKKLRWDDAIWGYRTPSNHFLYTILAKISHSTWQKIHQTKAWALNEKAIRLPAFIFGLASLFLWSRVALRLGFPSAACLLPFLLAIHPWFLRYITEARGYALCFFFLPASFLVAYSALASNRWKAWLSYGFLQFLLLYSWPGIVWQLLGTNIALLFLIQCKPISQQQKYRFYGSFFIANLLSAMLAIQLLAPCVPQVLAFMRDEIHSVALGSFWIKNLFADLFSGMEGVDYYHQFKGGEVNPLYVSLEGLMRKNPLPIYFVASVFLLSLVVGIFRLHKRGKISAAFAPMVILPAVAFYFFGVWREKYLFQWYFTYCLPVVFLIIAVGFTQLFRTLSGKKFLNPVISHSISIVLGLVTVFFFILITFPKTQLLRNFSLDPRRESVLTYRETTLPDSPDALKMYSAHVHYDARAYDPYAFFINDDEYKEETVIPTSITRLMRYSDEDNIPFFVNVGYPENAEIDEYYPKTMQILNNTDLFEEHAHLWAQQVTLVRKVYRYKGGFFTKKEQE